MRAYLAIVIEDDEQSRQFYQLTALLLVGWLMMVVGLSAHVFYLSRVIVPAISDTLNEYRLIIADFWLALRVLFLSVEGMVTR